MMHRKGGVLVEKMQLISGAEARKRVSRKKLFEGLARILILVEIALFVAYFVSERAGALDILLSVCGTAVIVFSGLAVLGSGDRARTCAHCGGVMESSTILSMPAGEDFPCPFCGAKFEAKLKKGEFNF